MLCEEEAHWRRWPVKMPIANTTEGAGKEIDKGSRGAELAAWAAGAGSQRLGCGTGCFRPTLRTSRATASSTAAADTFGGLSLGWDGEQAVRRQRVGGYSTISFTIVTFVVFRA